MAQSALATIPQALQALQRGEFVVVMDDEGRENEGDLVIAAEFMTPKKAAFMAKYTNGILCVPMTKARADELELPPMVRVNKDRNQTNFTVSCDAIQGISTGASAADRSTTANVLAAKQTRPEHLSRPGHIFPLVARDGGVLERRGHTEASVDLLKLAQLTPVAVICELMHEDGYMLRFQECCEFARTHNLCIITVEQLVAHRCEHDIALIDKSSAQPAVETSAIPFEGLDEIFMKQALTLSEQGRMSAPPNPWVGCVLVQNGRVIGQGWHKRAGSLHAEAEAVQDVRNRCGSEEEAAALISGCTAYVTLEPCSHTGRQPPCDALLIKMKVGRVVVGVTDPDPRVASRGLQNLRNAGIKVTEGILADEIKLSLRPYLHQRKTGKPWCVMKVACSVDGKIACEDKTSKWISSDEARAHAHVTRARSQAVIVGSGTCLSDNPSLTVRVAPPQITHQEYSQLQHPRGAPLLRVVLDSRGRIISGNLLEDELSKDTRVDTRTLVFTSQEAPEASKQNWEKANAEVVVVPRATGENACGLDIEHILKELGQRGVLQILVEGGSAIHGSFLAGNHVDELLVYHGNLLIGQTGIAWPAQPLARTIEDAHKKRWELMHCTRLGDTMCSNYVAGKEQ